MAATNTATRSAHTPGPWQSHSNHEPLRIVGNVELDGCEYTYSNVVEEVEGSTAGEALANAMLIVAAPDMLTALQIFVRQWNACGPNSEFGRYFLPVLTTAQRAIAKATGSR